jgi:hypothetical protein
MLYEVLRGNGGFAQGNKAKAGSAASQYHPPQGQSGVPLVEDINKF